MGLTASRKRSSAQHQHVLRPPASGLSLWRYVAALWRRKGFVRGLARAHAIGPHRVGLLGRLGVIVVPILEGLVYYLLFGMIFGGTKDIDNFGGYLAIGVAFFSYTLRTVTSASHSMVDDRQLVLGYQFPRAAIPIAVVWRETIAMLPVMYVLVIYLLVVPPQGHLGIHWLWVPLMLAVQLVLNLGLGLIAARVGVRHPGVLPLVPYVLRLVFYFSAGVYAAWRLADFAVLDAIAHGNPFFVLFDMARSVLLLNQPPDVLSWIVLGAWALALAVIGCGYFSRAEVDYAQSALD